jgi:RING-box protein 1
MSITNERTNDQGESHHTNSINEKKRRFEVVKFSPVVLWDWDVGMGVYAICWNNFTDVCIDCQAKQESGDKEDCIGL